MAGFFSRRRAGLPPLLLSLAAGMLTSQAGAQPAPGVTGRVPAGAASESSGVPSSSAAGSGASAPAAIKPPSRKWLTVPRVYGRITANELGIVINVDDPYSVQVGAYYAQARDIPDDRVLRVSLPIKSSLTEGEFNALRKEIDQFFGDRVQALALTWRLPYGVACNAITGALAMGFDAKLCSDTCAASRPSSYFGSASTAPWKDLRMRPAMMIAAKDVEGAKALIDRGVAADGTLGLRGAPMVHVHYVSTSDAVRSQRELLFPPPGPVPPLGLRVHVDRTEALRDVDRVLIYLTGRATLDDLDRVRYVPGALGDHLTSFGGVLDKPHGQTTVLSWIDAGVTASYGTASEPCAHLQKFPHPQGLLLFYAQGASALEAYWKSVAWPQQGLFVGEPLAAPFARRQR